MERRLDTARESLLDARKETDKSDARSAQRSWGVIQPASATPPASLRQPDGRGRVESASLSRRDRAGRGASSPVQPECGRSLAVAEEPGSIRGLIVIRRTLRSN